MKFAIPAAICLVIGLLVKMYLNLKISNTVKKYQGEIVRCHSHILMLEEKNSQLEKKLKEVEKSFLNYRLIMN